MTVFNRIRERETKKQVLTQNRYGKLGNAWKTVPDLSTSVTYRDLMKCEDITPVGKYLPGKFKITNLRLSTIEHQKDRIHGIVSNGTKDVHFWSGDFVFPLGITPPTSYAAPLLQGSVSKRVLRGAIAGVNAPDIDLGETGAEAASAFRMMANPIAGLAKILAGVIQPRSKKSFRKKSVNPADLISGRWLEARYGWVPLANTVKDLINDVGSPYPELMRSRSKELVQSATAVSAKYSNYSFNYAFMRRSTSTSKTMWRATVYYRVTDEAYYRAIKRGKTILNVGTLAWQLVPLSFAVDWWLGVGDWLYANMPNPTVAILGSTLSYAYENTIENSVGLCGLYPAPGSGYPWTPCFGRLITRQKVYERFVDPVPPPNVPLFDNRFKSWKHALDSVALAWQKGPSREQLTSIKRMF